MTDALCGPSNALQTFQKHSSADRTLQQDRFAFRQSPAQSFRSAPGPSAARAEADFQAFQAGPAAPALNFARSHEFLRGEQRRASPALPNWASEFQNLQIHEPLAAKHAPNYVHMPIQAASAPNAWHEEFMKVNTIPVTHATAIQPQYNPLSIPTRYQTGIPVAESTAFAATASAQHSHLVDDQHTQDAFSREFDLIDQEIDFSEVKGKTKESPVEQGSTMGQQQSWEHILSHADMHMGDITGDYDYDRGGTLSSEGVDVTDQLRTLRRDGGWEAVEAYEKAFARSNSPLGRDIVQSINQLRQEEDQNTNVDAEPARVQQRETTYGSDTASVRIGADTIPSTQEQAQPSGPEAEADELSKTAGQLLHNLREEQSSKFQNSSFMALMRQLRDREVRIEGDDMVSVSAPKTQNTSGLDSGAPLKVFRCSVMEG